MIHTFKSDIDKKGEAGHLKNLPEERGFSVLILGIENPDIENRQDKKTARAHLHVASNMRAGSRGKERQWLVFHGN